MRQSFTDFTRKTVGREVPAHSSNYNTDFVADTDVVREREDFMRETIREYSMNGSMIIGIDNGYGNTKTARTCFKTAIMKCDSKPVLSRNFIEYEGAYYVIGEGHKGFVSDKQQDEDNYILTLAAVAKELEARGMKEKVNRVRIHLAVGLPLKWVQAQRGDFKKYLMKNAYVEIYYKERLYCLSIAGCTVMPQCYAAVSENLKEFKGITLLADIGNGTMNLMYLNNGRPMESKAWTEKLGVFQCYQRISNMVQDATGDNLMEDVVENILRTGEIDLPEPHAGIIRKAIEGYTDEIFQKLRDHEFNEKLMKVYFMGGGARLVEQFGKYNSDTTMFNHDIKANAKGYEYYCYMIMRHQERAGR